MKRPFLVLSMIIMHNSPSGEIWFYSDKERPYGVFSNFYPVTLKITNSLGEIKEYPNSEAYFQAEKFTGPDATEDQLEYAELIRSQNTGNKAAVLARQKKPYRAYQEAQWVRDLWQIIQDYQARGVTIRSDWEDVKDNVMRRVVYQKFAQSELLRKILLDTGDKLIFEHTHRDSYWADGHPYNNSNIHGDGKNMLGIILEEVRYLLGGWPSTRLCRVPFEYSNWVIPGMLLMSGCPRRQNYLEIKNVGIRYFVSLMEYQQEREAWVDYRDEGVPEKGGDFCYQSKGITVARWGIKDRSVTSDDKANHITLRVIKAIGRGCPVMIHCFGGKGRAGTITSLVIGLMYGVDGHTAMDMAQRLFDDYRPNKGTKVAGRKGAPKGLKRDIPQTKSQVDQVIRILDIGLGY